MMTLKKIPNVQAPLPEATRERLKRCVTSLCWQWAEEDPFTNNDWLKRLRNLLKGLRVGRLRVAASDKTCEHLKAPIHEYPEKFESAFIVSLAVAVNSPEIWDEGVSWDHYFQHALSLAAYLHREIDVVSTDGFRKSMSYRADFAVGTITRPPMGYRLAQRFVEKY